MNPKQVYGKFRKDGNAFEITQRKTPRHWYNYFYNDEYIAFASQVAFGEGFAQDDLGRRVMVVENRMLYLADTADQSWFCANGLPMEQEYQEYSCSMSWGPPRSAAGIGISQQSTPYLSPAKGAGRYGSLRLQTIGRCRLRCVPSPIALRESTGDIARRDTTPMWLALTRRPRRQWPGAMRHSKARNQGRCTSICCVIPRLPDTSLPAARMDRMCRRKVFPRLCVSNPLPAD